MSKRLGPLALALGVGAGIALALSLGAYAPGWGPTLAFPAAVLVLGIGAWREDDGHELATLLRLGVGTTGGYLVAAIPLTWFAMSDAQVARYGGQVWSRWAVISLALAGGAALLALRGWRDRDERT